MNSDTQILFREEQRFRQKWLWALILPSLLLPLGIILYTTIRQYTTGIPVGNHHTSIENDILGFTIVLIVEGGVLWLLYAARLITELRTVGLYVQFFPFHFRFHKIELNEVQSFTARKYNPIGEYGGWGIRYGVKGKAYNVSGNYGVEFQYRNGKHLLIGSQKSEEFAKALEQILPGKKL